MEYTLDWKATDAGLFISLVTFITGFLCYFFISNSERMKSKFKLNFGDEGLTVKWILFVRLTGVLFLGIVPVFILIFLNKKNPSGYGFSFTNGILSLYWILGLSPVVILISYLNCRKKDNLEMYPQIRKTVWNTKLLIVSALSWTAYLLAYEFMFRGFLLFVSLEYMGVWPAVALNITLYSLAHVPKGIKEAIGAIPLGIVLCLITIKTGNIWVAFAVHVVMALSNEWLSIWANPEMKIVR